MQFQTYVLVCLLSALSKHKCVCSPNESWQDLAWKKTWEGSGCHHRWGTSIIMQMNLPKMPRNCRINLSESKELHCSNTPWHVYILPINNPRKDCRHVFADSSVFGLEIQKINNDEAQCQETTADRWTRLHLRCEEREGGNEKADIRHRTADQKRRQKWLQDCRSIAAKNSSRCLWKLERPGCLNSTWPWTHTLVSGQTHKDQV